MTGRQKAMQTFDVGSKNVPRGHVGAGGVGAASVGLAVGAEFAAATPVLPKSSPPATVVAISKRMITFRMMFPTPSGTPIVTEHCSVTNTTDLPRA